MTGIPILRLPFVPQMEILKHVDNKDLFFLSFISARSKNLVQLANRSFEDARIRFKEDEELRIYENKPPILILVKNKGQATFRGVDKMAISYVGRRPWPVAAVYYEAGKYHEMENRVIRHLFSVFKKVKVSVQLENDEKIESNALWNYTKSLEHLEITMQNRKLTAEEITFLSNELTISQVFTMYAPRLGFEYQSGFFFTHKKLFFTLPQCINMDAIIASQSLYLMEIKCPSFPPAFELNRLMKAWIAGGSMENLKFFLIVSEEDAPPGFLDAIADGIPTYYRGSSLFRIQRHNGEQAMFGLIDKQCVFRFDHH